MPKDRNARPVATRAGGDVEALQRRHHSADGQTAPAAHATTRIAGRDRPTRAAGAQPFLKWRVDRPLHRSTSEAELV
jgi:hypothetical protein